MSRHFLVDGYNVLHKMPELAPQAEEFAGRTLEEGRDGLVRFIAGRRPHGSLRNAVTVVFDGSMDVCSLNVPGEVKVIFSKGESADDLIKRLIEESLNPREIVLVSEFLAQGDKNTSAHRKPRGASGKSSDGKVIPEVFKARVNRELEKTWLRPGEGR
jgi:predicted RNA-binding protein with PIN domain